VRVLREEAEEIELARRDAQPLAPALQPAVGGIQFVGTKTIDVAVVRYANAVTMRSREVSDAKPRTVCVQIARNRRVVTAPAIRASEWPISAANGEFARRLDS
jgi:hypothetical protein